MIFIVIILLIRSTFNRIYLIGMFVNETNDYEECEDIEEMNLENLTLLMEVI